MKRIVPVVVLGSAVVGYLAGYAVSPAGSITAQGPGGVPALTRAGYPPLSPDQPAKAQHFNIDDLRRQHTERVAATVAGTPLPPSQLMMSRTHNIQLVTRVAHDTPQPSSMTRRMSRFGEAEQHEGVSDVYIVIAGTGTIVTGGEIERREYRPADPPSTLFFPGEYVGLPIIGGESIKVKPGDVLTIPPNTPHWAQPDAGGMTYALLKVNVGLYPWPLSR